MTTEQLLALPNGTEIFLPDGWTVSRWLTAGAVEGTQWFTLRYPPDKDGVTDNRRPVYIGLIELMAAKLSENDAWRYNLTQVNERARFIETMLARTNP